MKQGGRTYSRTPILLCPILTACFASLARRRSYGYGLSQKLTNRTRQDALRDERRLWNRSVCTAAGFTIVESMIVLAVTGILVVSALLFINGRQNKTEFQVGINNLQQQLQQIINETESGYYPTSNSSGSTNFTCTKSANGKWPKITAAAGSQGTNGDCIFLGKVIYFGPGNAGDTYTVFPIAGNRLSGDTPITTLAQAWPVAVSRGVSTNTQAPAGNYATYPLEDGLSYDWGVNPNAGAHNPFAMGILSTVGVLTSSGGGSFESATSGVSGATQFSLYGFHNGWPAGEITSPEHIVDHINDATQNANSTDIRQALGSVQFCISSGTTNQSGLFTVTLGLTVSLQIKNGPDCGAS